MIILHQLGSEKTNVIRCYSTSTTIHLYCLPSSDPLIPSDSPKQKPPPHQLGVTIAFPSSSTVTAFVRVVRRDLNSGVGRGGRLTSSEEFKCRGLGIDGAKYMHVNNQ